MSNLTVKEFAKMGNKAFIKKYSKEQRAKWAGKSKQALIAKYGPDYFKKIAQKSVEARKKKREKKPIMNQILGIK